MVYHTNDIDHVYHKSKDGQTAGFCSGISTSSYTNSSIHGDTKRVSSEWIRQEPRPTVAQKYLWPEASWQGME
jgi:hypothetical protein